MPTTRATAASAPAPTATGPTPTPALSPRQSLAVSITLFSMFFGAGNLILPPLVGLQAGQSGIAAMVGFLVTGIGLPVLGIVAVALAGTARQLAARVHPRFADVFVAAVYLAIGPCLAIPRTSSTAFEMLVPLLPADAPVQTARLAFSVAFFAAAYALALHPGKLTGLLGRVTGPALIGLIVVVVASAIIAPAGEAVPATSPYDNAPAVQGFLAGYQTMDLLASLTFGIVIATNVREMGVAEPAGVAREVSRAGVLAGALMALIYCGLAWVGASLGTVTPDAANGAALLTASATLHFGVAGTVVVAVIFLLACLNVCIGLISCCGTYFAQTFGADAAPAAGAAPARSASNLLSRASYPVWAFAFAAVSCVLSNFGLDAILAFSVPLLGALYPMAIMLVLMGMFHRACDAHPKVWPWAVGLAGAQSVAVALRDALAPTLWLPLDALPLADLGLGWVVPAVVGLLVGAVHSRLVVGRGAEKR